MQAMMLAPRVCAPVVREVSELRLVDMAQQELPLLVAPAVALQGEQALPGSPVWSQAAACARLTASVPQAMQQVNPRSSPHWMIVHVIGAVAGFLAAVHWRLCSAGAGPCQSCLMTTWSSG